MTRRTRSRSAGFRLGSSLQFKPKPNKYGSGVSSQLFVKKCSDGSHLVVLGPVSVRVPPSMINSSSSLSARIGQSTAALENSRVVSPDRGRERVCKSSHSALPRNRHAHHTTQGAETMLRISKGWKANELEQKPLGTAAASRNAPLVL